MSLAVSLLISPTWLTISCFDRMDLSSTSVDSPLSPWDPQRGRRLRLSWHSSWRFSASLFASAFESAVRLACE